MANQKAASFMEATGVIEYNMTNNYMFRYILQKNKKVLKGLICALLHLRVDEVKSIEITNPIDLAGNVSGKEFILDIKVMLNNNTLINIEMQVANEHNWPERSLGYACREYDQLQKGQQYEETLPVIHIGFLMFTPFKNVPEFYARYMMMNVKNHNVYSDKLILSVVDLTKVELATEEDKAYKIDYWARLFKAKTWEDLKMLARENEYLQEAADSLFVANADEIIRQQCQAREDAEKRERTLERDNKLLKEQMKEKDEQISLKDEVISQKDEVISQKDEVISQKDEEISQKDEVISQKDEMISQKDQEIEELKKILAERV